MKAIVRSAVDLGISLVTAENVDRAYRRAARDIHPDKAGGDTKEFQELLEAKEGLKAAAASPALKPRQTIPRTVSPPPRPKHMPTKSSRPQAWSPAAPDLSSMSLDELLGLAAQADMHARQRIEVRWVPSHAPSQCRTREFEDWRPGSIVR